MNKSFNLQQYQRQLILPGMGETGQRKLQQAKILVIGAGGLGCPALQYLVAAGIGNIGIVDGDIIDITNLHRQVLFGGDDIGKSKAIVSGDKLKHQNPGCNITTFNFFIDKTNAFGIMEAFDIIVDGSDNFSTRYLVNDVCVLLNKPLAYGAIYRFEGQVALFNCPLENGTYSAHYRDLFPEPPSNIQNCAEAGVLGMLPGIIGCMQAAEVVKLITGLGKPLINSLLNYNTLTNESYIVSIEATEEGGNAVPADKTALLNTNYEIDCIITNNVIEITAEAFNSIINNQDFLVIDVRDLDELPLVKSFGHIKMPSGSFNGSLIEADKIVLFCQSGVRSKKAASKILETFPYKKVYSLKGGIVAWLDLIRITNGA